MRTRLPEPLACPAHPSIEDYAFLTLRLLDKEGPPGWLHAQWLIWADEQPELLARLTQHSLELDSLLTPAAFPMKPDDPNWERQEEIGKDWQAKRDTHGLQTRLLQASSAARYPHALLYRQLLQAETQSKERWQTVWNRLLDAEMRRGHPATYQACLHLRLMLAAGNQEQRITIVSTLLQHLSSNDRLQIQSMNAIINIYLGDLSDLRYLRDLRDLRDLSDMISTLCNILRQETVRQQALFTLYSVVSAVDVPGSLEQQIEQSLRQIIGQAPLPLEQRLLIIALLQHIRLVLAFPMMPTGTTDTADERIHRLNHLKEHSQRKQLERSEEEELLSACYDWREVSESAWKTVTGQDFFWNNTVAQVAWRLLAGQWNMTREAWQDVVTRLDNEDGLMCGAAAMLLQKGGDIPAEEREQAIKRIQAILNDEMLSRRPLDPPDGDWLRLDDVLFDTLRVLAERG